MGEEGSNVLTCKQRKEEQNDEKKDEQVEGEEEDERTRLYNNIQLKTKFFFLFFCFSPQKTCRRSHQAQRSALKEKKRVKRCISFEW